MLGCAAVVVAKGRELGMTSECVESGASTVVALVTVAVAAVMLATAPDVAVAVVVTVSPVVHGSAVVVARWAELGVTSGALASGVSVEVLVPPVAAVDELESALEVIVSGACSVESSFPVAWFPANVLGTDVVMVK